jgi:hypothetical protein
LAEEVVLFFSPRPPFPFPDMIELGVDDNDANAAVDFMRKR